MGEALTTVIGRHDVPCVASDSAKGARGAQAEPLLDEAPRTAYYVLRDAVDDRDLGVDHYDRLAPEKLTRYLVKRLERLGHKVTLGGRRVGEPSSQCYLLEPVPFVTSF